MSKSNGNKVRLSVQTLAVLEMLREAKAAEDPFQELDITKAVRRI